MNKIYPIIFLCLMLFSCTKNIQKNIGQEIEIPEVEIDENYNTESYIRHAYILIASGEFEHAIAFCNAIIQIDPDYYKAYFYRGIAYYYMENQKGRYIGKATADLKRAFELIGGLYFIPDRALFLSEMDYEIRLQEIADMIKELWGIMPNQVFLIVGYAAVGRIPDEKEEMELSVQRADRVKIILINFGVPNKNLECVYMGGTNKWGNNSSEETRKQNRVVKIEFKE